jgi:hypothetical protein
MASGFAEAVMFPTCIQEELFSNLGPDTGYLDKKIYL